MYTYLNSFSTTLSQRPFGNAHSSWANFVIRFGNNYAVSSSVSLERGSGHESGNKMPDEYIEIAVFGGERMMDLGEGSGFNAVALVSPNEYTSVLSLVRELPAYDPELNCEYDSTGFLKYPSSNVTLLQIQSITAVHMKTIRHHCFPARVGDTNCFVDANSNSL